MNENRTGKQIFLFLVSLQFIYMRISHWVLLSRDFSPYNLEFSDQCRTFSGSLLKLWRIHRTEGSLVCFQLFKSSGFSSPFAPVLHGLPTFWSFRCTFTRKLKEKKKPSKSNLVFVWIPEILATQKLFKLNLCICSVLGLTDKWKQLICHTHGSKITR